MTDVLEGVRDHYRATGLTERMFPYKNITL